MKHGSSSSCEIFNGYNLVEDVQNVSSYCKVDNGMRGIYDLKVTTTIIEAAQRYICLEPGSLDEASAEIIILGWYFAAHGLVFRVSFILRIFIN